MSALVARTALARVALAAALLLAAGTGRAAAQDSLPQAPADTAARADTAAAPADTVAARPAVDSAALRRPTSPMGALWRSILLPGWGQAKLGRKTTGALFVVWEGVTLGMVLKTQHELDYLRRTGSGRVESKKQEREDWLVLLAFNHLFAALEAYVSAHLWDFPEDLRIRALPEGGIGGQVTLPLRVP